MPYIKQEIRDRIMKCQNLLALYPEGGPTSAGELNFAITMLLHNYLQRMGVKYQNLNEIIGVLECAKLELYRMVVASYEDKKRVENGSISKFDDDSCKQIR